MRLLATLSAGLIGFFLYGLYLNQFEFQIFVDDYSKPYSGKYYDYRGAINVHSDVSFGSGNVNFISVSAKTAELDYLFLTDYNMTFPWPYSDSYKNGLLLLAAPKISYMDSRIMHYAFGKNQAQNLPEAQLKLTDSLSQNHPENHDELTILAHPLENEFKWKGDVPSGLDGVEVINLKSVLKKAWAKQPLSTIWSFLVYPFNSKLAFLRIYNEPDDEFAFYDNAIQKRPLVGVLGSEATAKAIPFSEYLVKFPSYRKLFEIGSNHVLLESELTGNFQNDRKKIVSAFKQGHVYFALDLLGDPRGFYAEAVSGSQRYLIGSQLKYKPGLSIHFQLPQRPRCFFEIILLKDGQSVGISNSEEGDFKITEPGNYRLQVRVSPLLPIPDAKKWISWIYTNPIYILP